MRGQPLKLKDLDIEPIFQNAGRRICEVENISEDNLIRSARAHNPVMETASAVRIEITDILIERSGVPFFRRRGRPSAPPFEWSQRDPATL